jgi:hypothetical protein
MPVQLERRIGRLHAQHDGRTLGPAARIADAKCLDGMFDELLDPRQCRMRLLTVLMIRKQ